MKSRLLTISIGALTVSSALLSACGSSSSVKKWNQQQASSVPVAQAQQMSANVVTPAPIISTTVIAPPPPTASAITNIANIKVTSANPNWVEGKSETISGTAALLVGSSAFTVKMVGQPSWLTLTQNMGPNKNQLNWQIQGTPPLDFTNGDAKRSVSFYLEIKISGSLAPDVSSIVASSPGQLKHLLSFDVNQTNAIPLVTSLKGLSLDQSEAVQEGTVRAFTVEVSDAGAAGQAPDLKIISNAEQGNSESVRLDGHEFVKVDPAHPIAERVADSKWRFSFLFDAKEKALPRPTVKAQNSYEDEAELTFALHVISRSKLDSVHPVTFNVKYDMGEQAPKITLGTGSVPELKLGQTTTLAFEIHSDLPKTILTVDESDVNAQLKKIGLGQSQFKCKSQEEQKMICGLQWTLSCDDKIPQEKPKITLKASNKLGGISASASFEQELTITKSQIQCPSKSPSAGVKK